MFQPFEIFKAEYIDRLIQLNKIYLVSQSYPRAIDPLMGDNKINLLFTDYNDKDLAAVHLKALSTDPYAAIIDLSSPKHLLKVKEMSNENSSYRLHWAIVKNSGDIKKKMDHQYKDHIRRYVSQYTHWRIGAEEHFRPSFQVIFGELFIVLKSGSQTLRVKFEEIEKV